MFIRKEELEQFLIDYQTPNTTIEVDRQSLQSHLQELYLLRNEYKKLKEALITKDATIEYYKQRLATKAVLILPKGDFYETII